MNKTIPFILLGVGVSAVMLAGPGVPEIDPGAGVNAVTLIAGAVLLFRGRGNKK